MAQHVTTGGETIEYGVTDLALAAFLPRVFATSEDTTLTADDLIELVFGIENPVMATKFVPRRAYVTPEVAKNPVYKVMNDLVYRKQVLRERTPFPRRVPRSERQA
jgi:hypothetical protein